MVRAPEGHRSTTPMTWLRMAVLAEPAAVPKRDPCALIILANFVVQVGGGRLGPVESEICVAVITERLVA
jgi:hypothetical protein